MIYFDERDSRELKTPLTVIRTNVELLSAPGYGEAARQQSVQSILTMSGQIRGLVEQLLSLTRIDNGRAQTVFTRVDASKVVPDAVLSVEPLFFEKDVELTCQVESGLTAKGSEAHRRQAVDILPDNAQKYAALSSANPYRRSCSSPALHYSPVRQSSLSVAYFLGCVTPKIKNCP